MKALKKTYSVKIGEEDGGDLYELVIDLASNEKSYSTQVAKDIDVNDNWQWVTVPIECPHMIKNIDMLVQNDNRVVGIEITFEDGSYVNHLRSAHPDSLFVNTEKHGEYLFHIHNREVPNPDSEIYENELVWSLCWDHFPSNWINEHGELEQI
ncbi:hypothetical protein OCT50_08160 [Leclercia adecarboxylata]|uniref:hypothetical protein n=1 Tax=Leclercia adecarboxylata TaxID=83655 RepID=UPI0025AFA33E|nr:hypothetical protein [Leclercia adecarboxylata]WJT04734.1 hypothetical protein OCT50_08160 [Leclercia adecarboxylata]